MKYLQDYQEAQQTALFEKTGAFFAFSMEQFNESKKEGVKYVNMGSSMISPKGNVKELIEGLDSIYNEAIKKDIQENGKEAIILRELYNHECFYTCDPTDAIEKLESYPFTKEEIIDIYRTERQKNN